MKIQMCLSRLHCDRRIWIPNALLDDERNILLLLIREISRRKFLENAESHYGFVDAENRRQKKKEEQNAKCTVSRGQTDCPVVISSLGTH